MRTPMTKIALAATSLLLTAPALAVHITSGSGYGFDGSGTTPNINLLVSGNGWSANIGLGGLPGNSAFYAVSPTGGVFNPLAGGTSAADEVSATVQIGSTWYGGFYGPNTQLFITGASINVTGPGIYSEAFTLQGTIGGTAYGQQGGAAVAENIYGVGQVVYDFQSAGGIPGYYLVPTETYTFTSTPEPGAVGLLGLGLLSLTMRRRRRC